jgi:hypothetical protein
MLNEHQVIIQAPQSEGYEPFYRLVEELVKWKNA